MDAAANILFGKTRQAVLVLLFEQAESSFYLREIARLTSLAPSQLQTELTLLCKADLVLRVKDGNRVSYQANARHPVFPELQSLVAKTCGLPARLKAALMPSAEAIEFATIYGSIAKGSNHAASDVDLLVVGDLTLEQVIALIQPLEEQLGRQISIRLYQRHEFAERQARGDAFILGVLSGAMIALLGQWHDA